MMVTNIILRSNEVVHHVLGLFSLLLLLHKSDAYEFIVGGQKGWSVPSDPNSNPYNQWAEKIRFQVGDTLVFNYPSGQDSIIEVTSQDYASCNTDANSGKFSNGHTVIELKQSGPHFFISGNKNNCLKNEKLVVIVLADRNNRNSNTNQTSTASSPSPFPSITASSPSPSPSITTESLAPSPASVQQQQEVLPPPPTQQEASSPPLVTEVTNPTPAPVSEPPPPNAASSVFLGFAGSAAAFMASVLVFSF